MKRIAIYSRKSVLTDTGSSTKVQIKLCKEYFLNKYKNCKFEIFEDEGFSGGNINRPDFQIMMSKIDKKSFDIVAVYKVDRIARNITDFFSIFNKLEILNVELVSITEGFDPSTPMGKMTMTMLAGLAEMERMQIKQRVVDNMRELAREGKWTGGNAPIGYEAYRSEANGKLCSYLSKSSNISEINIVKDIYNLFLNGYGGNKISNIINEKYNISTSQRRVSNILTSPTYTNSSNQINDYLTLNGYDVYGEPNGQGYLTYQKSTTTITGSKILDRANKTIAAVSKHDAIIDNQTWLAAQYRVKEITIDPKPRKSQYTFLAHLVKCGYCNKPMNVCMETRKTIAPNRFFKKTCKCDHTPDKFRGCRLTIDRAEEYLFTLLSQIDSVDKVKQFIEDSSPHDYSDDIKKSNSTISKLNAQIHSLTDKLSIVNNDVADVIINKISSLVEDKRKIQEHLLELETKQSYISSDNKKSELMYDTIQNILINKKNLSIAELNIMIQQVIDGVYWKGKEQDYAIKLLEL